MTSFLCVKLDHVDKLHCIASTLEAGHCQFLGSEKFGAVFVCLLWSEDRGKRGTAPTILKESRQGRILRCARCLESEVAFELEEQT